jgi:hypothetical protein
MLCLPPAQISVSRSFRDFPFEKLSLGTMIKIDLVYEIV